MSITIHPLLQLVVVGMFLAVPSLTSATESQCFGTVGNGRIEGSVKLPANGSNFSVYSAAGAAAVIAQWLNIQLGLVR